jgi:Alcohol dehydrogenase GroES-like domain
MATAVAATIMKAAQVAAPGAGLRIVELEDPDPRPGQVRIRVKACGVCHSDAIIVEGRRPGTPIREAPYGPTAAFWFHRHLKPPRGPPLILWSPS